MKNTLLQKRAAFTILLLVLIPVSLFAQTIPEPTQTDIFQISSLSYNASVNESDIDVTINPEFPKSFERVSIRLDSNSIDLNRYMIQWTTDMFEQKSGIGMRDFIVQSGNYGSRKKITVIISGSGVRIVKNITIAPQDATLLWEAIDSYVPPFYHGKKMASQESLIKISGLPNFKLINDSIALNDAVYIWSRNDNKILNTGGYGKDSITIQHNKLRSSEKITANISNISGGTKAQQSITIPITDPQIHWYYRDIYNYRKLLSIDRGLRVGQGDTTIIAEPYFFSLSKVNDLNFTWKMNNETLYLDPSAPRQELLVRNPNQSGQVTFSTSIENPNTFLQTASGSTTLYFQKP